MRRYYRQHSRANNSHMNKSDYRPNVCVVVQHPENGKVLLCHRCGFLPDEGWQFPQGGIDETLPLEQEMRRELKEEAGTDEVDVVAVSADEYCYDFPEHAYLKRGGFRGQRQKWFLVRLRDEKCINVNTRSPEFDTYEWVSPKIALMRAVGFKQSIYHKALTELNVL